MASGADPVKPPVSRFDVNAASAPLAGCSTTLVGGPHPFRGAVETRLVTTVVHTYHLEMRVLVVPLTDTGVCFVHEGVGCLVRSCPGCLATDKMRSSDAARRETGVSILATLTYG